MRSALRNLLLFGGQQIQYLLLARFGTDIAAPLPASLPVDVGGPLTVVQNDGQFSKSGGALAIPTQGTPLWGDQGFYGPGLARVAGRTLLATFRRTTVNKDAFPIAWMKTQTVDLSSGINGAAGLYVYDYLMLDGTTANLSLGATFLAQNTTYDVAIVLRGAGAFFFVRGGVFINWTLIWVLATGTTTPLYPTFSNFNIVGTLDNFRVVDLGTYDSRFLTDYGIATNRLTSPAAGATTTSEADALVEYTVTTLPSALVLDVHIRKQDATNYWEIRLDTTGNLYLTEVVAGVRTQRAATGGTANGHRVVIIAEGTTIKGYSNNTLRWTYSSAANFATATGVVVAALGTGGAISELVCWPRTLSLPGGV